MTQHKPEPWASFNDASDGLEYGNNNERIYSVSLYEIDYNRARACVNACAGTSDFELEGMNIKRIKQLLIDSDIARIEAEQQRDELQVAANNCYLAWESEGTWSHIRPELTRLEKAILELQAIAKAGVE